MNCRQVVSFCLDFLDGSLPEEDRAAFEDHLGCCAPCITFFETYRRTTTLSRDALAAAIPPDVKDAVRSFLRSRYSESDR